MPHRRSQRPIRDIFTREELEAKVVFKVTALDLLDLTLNWEMFRSVPYQNLDFKRQDPSQPSQDGRPPFDAALMFKVLVLQKYHASATMNISVRSQAGAASSASRSSRSPILGIPEILREPLKMAQRELLGGGEAENLRVKSAP